MFFQLFTRKEAYREVPPEQEHEAGLSLFMKTLGVLLPEDEGVVVNVTEDAEKVFGFNRAIIFNKDGQINIMEESKGFLEGQRIYIH